jgi:glycosyltransferase involved in cell wall biosynthesis
MCVCRRAVWWPQAAIVVPARYEAPVLPVSLPTLLAQKYPGRARVIMVDDHSSDGTGALAAELRTMDGLELIVTAPPPLPPGWTGKLGAAAWGGAGRSGRRDGLSLELRRVRLSTFGHLDDPPPGWTPQDSWCPPNRVNSIRRWEPRIW